MPATAFTEHVIQIKENLQEIDSRIRRAAERTGRDPSEIKIIAVTKLMPLETIKAGIEAGLRDFGENYPEQAVEKIKALTKDVKITWHMIGHIQSRKTDTVCSYFDWVHSVDRMKIVRYLDRYSREAGQIMPVLIEVNLSGEESKFGWKAWDEDAWSELIPQFGKISEMANIEIHGLMTMPPFFDDPELTRPYYRRLRRLQVFLQNELPDVCWDSLSIGTSFDYEVAIEEGATMVRLGTSIFGPRPTR
jgi:PLP dependent protein